jgi:hypothetical protein
MGRFRFEVTPSEKQGAGMELVHMTELPEKAAITQVLAGAQLCRTQTTVAMMIRNMARMQLKRAICGCGSVS